MGEPSDQGDLGGKLGLDAWFFLYLPQTLERLQITRMASFVIYV